ncbi:hypothetical protein KI387_025326, partial [Taxus chinensis]
MFGLGMGSGYHLQEKKTHLSLSQYSYFRFNFKGLQQALLSVIIFSMAETNIIEEDDGCFADLANQIALMINMDDEEEREDQATLEPEGLCIPSIKGSSVINSTAHHGYHTLPRVFYNNSYPPVHRGLVGGRLQAPSDFGIMHQIFPIKVINMGIWNRQHCRCIHGNLIPIETANGGNAVQRECLGTGVFIPRSRKFKSKAHKDRQISR